MREAMKSELFDQVLRAQQGDKEALYEIIRSFLPAIRSARRKIKGDRQEDLEQNIIEIIIKKIMSFDLVNTLDFTGFCQQLNEIYESEN